MRAASSRAAGRGQSHTRGQSPPQQEDGGGAPRRHAALRRPDHGGADLYAHRDAPGDAADWPSWSAMAHSPGLEPPRGGGAGAARRAPRPPHAVFAPEDFHDGQMGYKVDYGPANWGARSRLPPDHADRNGTHHPHAARAAPRRPAHAACRSPHSPTINIDLMQNSGVSIGSVNQTHGAAAAGVGAGGHGPPEHSPTAAGLWFEGPQCQEVAPEFLLRDLVAQVRAHQRYTPTSHKLPKEVSDATLGAIKLALNGSQNPLGMHALARQALEDGARRVAPRPSAEELDYLLDFKIHKYERFMLAYEGADISPLQSLQRYSELYRLVCAPFAEAIQGYSRNLATATWTSEPPPAIVIAQARQHFAAHAQNTQAAAQMVMCCFPVDDEALIMQQLGRLEARRITGLFSTAGDFHNQATQLAFATGRPESGPAKPPTKPPTKPAPTPAPGGRMPVREYPACEDGSRRCFNHEFKTGGCIRPRTGTGACTFKHEKLCDIADPAVKAAKTAEWAAACAAHGAGH